MHLLFCVAILVRDLWFQELRTHLFVIEKAVGQLFTKTKTDSWLKRPYPETWEREKHRKVLSEVKDLFLSESLSHFSLREKIFSTHWSTSAWVITPILKFTFRPLRWSSLDHLCINSWLKFSQVHILERNWRKYFKILILVIHKWQDCE